MELRVAGFGLFSVERRKIESYGVIIPRSNECLIEFTHDQFVSLDGNIKIKKILAILRS